MPPKRDQSTIDADAPGYRLEYQIGHLLRRAHQRASAIFMTRFAVHRLTPTQFAALVKIGDEGEVPQNQLGRLTAMDPATMKGVIDRLHARSLIVSKPDPTDRRRTLWRLTESGARTRAQALPTGAETSKDTLAPLDAAERRVFLELLSRLT